MGRGRICPGAGGAISGLEQNQQDRRNGNLKITAFDVALLKMNK